MPLARCSLRCCRAEHAGFPSALCPHESPKPPSTDRSLPLPLTGFLSSHRGAVAPLPEPGEPSPFAIPQDSPPEPGRPPSRQFAQSGFSVPLLSLSALAAGLGFLAYLPSKLQIIRPLGQAALM